VRRVPIFLRLRRLRRDLLSDDREVRRAAIGELQATGRRAIPLLRVALTDRNHENRIRTIGALIDLDDRASITDLLPILHDDYRESIGGGRVDFPVRAAALRALRTFRWSPRTHNERLLVRAAEGTSIDNYHFIAYFLGAGFASCYGFPLARDLPAFVLPELWEVDWSFRRFAVQVLRCRTAEDVAALSMSDVFDALEFAAASDDAPRAASARAAMTELQWVLRQRFDLPEGMERWKPDNPILDRFFRFLVANNHHNFIVTTNWDTYLDGAFQGYLNPRTQTPLSYVDYGLYAHDRLYADTEYVPIHLYKMNGSADWLWCPQCRKLFGGFLPWPFANYDAIIRNPVPKALAEAFLCGFCGNPLSQMMVMPSPARPQHLFSIGYEIDDETRKEHEVPMTDGFEPTAVLDLMSTMMQACSLWIFMGYSLPEYDRDTVSVIKRAFARRAKYHPASPLTIHVVGFEPTFRSRDESWICRRYADVLQHDFEYFPTGIEKWIEDHVPNRPV
jgi:hypothetical protein